MKMQPAHYAELAKALDSVAPMLRMALPSYRSHGLSDKRLQWDGLRAAQVNGNSIRWLCDVLYQYLDDSHVQTALSHWFRTNGIAI